MEKRISNILDYTNYQLLLSDDFARRVAINPNYSLRSYADDIGISAGYLSKVINRKKDLSKEKGRIIFSHLGYQGEELDFIEDLIDLNTTQDLNKKIHLKNKINEIYNTTPLDGKTDAQVPQTTTVAHFFTYGFVRDIKEISTLYKLNEQIHITQEQTNKALSDLQKSGYIKIDKETAMVTEKDFNYVRSHDDYFNFAMKLSKSILKAYSLKGENSTKNNCADSLILGMGESQMQEFHDLQKHYILTLLKISERCRTPEKYILINNIFTVLNK